MYLGFQRVQIFFVLLCVYIDKKGTLVGLTPNSHIILYFSDKCAIKQAIKFHFYCLLSQYFKKNSRVSNIKCYYHQGSHQREKKLTQLSFSVMSIRLLSFKQKDSNKQSNEGKNAIQQETSKGTGWTRGEERKTLKQRQAHEIPRNAADSRIDRSSPPQESRRQQRERE